MQIRPAHPHHRRAWRMLLPHVAAGPDPFRVLVAIAPLEHAGVVAPRVAGAIAISVNHLYFATPGPRVALHVIPTVDDRDEVARRLIETAAAFAGRDAAALYTWDVLDPAGSEAATWQSLGFDERIALSEQEVSLRQMEARLGTIHARALERGRIPADARLVLLEDVTKEQFEQLVELHVRYLGGTPMSVRAFLLSRMPPDGDGQFSMALLRGDRVVGFELTRLVDRRVCVCDTEVLDTSHRGRWANVWLKLEPCRRLLAAGAEVVRFESFPHNTDTRSFTEQLGGATLRESVRLFRRLPPSQVH